MFDYKDDFLSADIQAIIHHHYMADILEFNPEYTNGDTSWNTITVVKDEDPHDTANYIIGNDLGPISNGIHGRWARKFLRSLKQILRRLRKLRRY